MGREFGGRLKRNSPLAQQGEILCHHRRNSPMVKAWLHAGGMIFLRKLGNTAAAKVLRRKPRAREKTKSYGG